MQKEMNTWRTLKDKLKLDQVLTLQMSDKFRQKCSQLELNEILSPFTKIYREKRPKNMLSDDAPFYVAINHTRKKDSTKKWFKSAPVGSNKLNTLMKTMASKANLNNERLTNHSARKHMIHKLNDHEIPHSHT